MSLSHLDALRNELEKHHWRITAEMPGNEYDISAVWQIARPDGSETKHIEFEGLDDLKTLPISDSYGCRVREIPSLNLYFGKFHGSAFQPELVTFVQELHRSTT